VIYHKDWIVNNLPKKHPIFKSRLFISNIAERLRLKENICLSHHYCSICKLAATGLPDTLVLLNRLNQLESRIEANERASNEKFMEFFNRSVDQQIALACYDPIAIGLHGEVDCCA